MDDEEEARAFCIARELIAEHGANVASFLQAKIDELMDSRDFEQLRVWSIIRNAVGLTIKAQTTLH